MKKLQFLSIVLIITLSGCGGNNNSTENDQASEAIPDQVLNVNEILESPDQYSDKTIKVTGLVTHVCRHSGKRLHLTSPETNKMIRIEAAEGINQFERELEGSEITVTGIFKKQVIDEDYLAKWEDENNTGEGVHIDHSPMEEEEKTERISNLRKRLEESGESQLISYWIDGNSFQIN